MTDDQIYEFAQRRGAAMKDWLTARITSGAWDGRSQEEMQDDVRRMSRKLTGYTKAGMLTGEWDKVPGLPPPMAARELVEAPES